MISLNKAKVLFVEPPPTIDWQPGSGISKAGRRHPALSVTGEVVYSYLNLSAAAVLREHGHQVDYIHSQIQGMSLKAVKKRILELSPDVLVIELEHINLGVSLKVAEAAHRNGTRVVFVGPMATAMDEQALDFPCDIIVRREWDYTLNHLVTALASGRELHQVKGLIFRQNGHLVRTDDADLIENLDDLPIPAYDLVDLSKCWESMFLYNPTVTVISSRGCPYHCTYCSYPQTIFSHKFRAQSPERVLEEAIFLKDKLGVKAIRYDDDFFDFDQDRVFKVCELFRKVKSGLRWMIQSRPASMTLELARSLKKAGCYMVMFGIETSSNEILSKVKKGATIDEIVNGYRIAREVGLEISNSIMIGFYWDKKESIEQSIRLAYKLNAEFTEFTLPIPLPGTEYFEFLKDKNCFRSQEWEDFNSAHNSNQDLPNFTNEYINSRLKKAYRYYYLRPRYLAMMLGKSIASLAKMRRLVWLVQAFGKRLLWGWI